MRLHAVAARSSHGCVLAFATGCDASSSGSSDSSPGKGKRLDQQDVDRLMTDPDSYKGATITVTGRVFDIERDEGQTAVQMDPGGDGNLIVYMPGEDFDVSEDDYATVTGEVTGELTGENAFGAEVTAPTIEATTAKKTTAAALDPAEDTLPGKSVQTTPGSSFACRRSNSGRRNPASISRSATTPKRTSASQAIRSSSSAASSLSLSLVPTHPTTTSPTFLRERELGEWSSTHTSERSTALSR
jgi:hypothetical protein